MKIQFSITCLLMLALVSARAQTDTSQFVYHKPLFDFDYEKPVFKLDSQQLRNETRQLRFFLFTGYREGVAPYKGQMGFNVYSKINEQNGNIKLSTYNVSIVDMVTRGIALVTPGMILLEVKDPSKYRYLPEYGDRVKWLRKNAWCYELLVPRAAFSVMLTPAIDKQIAERFGISWGMERRKVKARVLVRTSAADLIKSDGLGVAAYGVNGIYKNTNLAQIGKYMDAVKPQPFIDETHYEGKVDMDLGPVDYGDFNAVRAALNRYDLDLKEEIRDVKMMVIKEVR